MSTPLNDSAEYYVMARANQSGMLLYSLPDTADDESWTDGKRFEHAPEEPVEIEIVTGYERAPALHWFGSTPVVSKVLFEVLREAGVSNLDGYKAINIVGMVPEATPLDPAHTGWALMFRHGRFSGSVVVHRRVKEAIEAAQLPWISFAPHR